MDIWANVDAEWMVVTRQLYPYADLRKPDPGDARLFTRYDESIGAIMGYLTADYLTAGY